jgi:aminopeptidase YwaD
MPKNFPFYNPEEHQRIYRLLEKKSPAAVITATRKNPEAVGALDPFPMIVDGDFDIPSVYCSEETGRKLARHAGERITLILDAERIPAEGANVIARSNPEAGAGKRIVLTAHIDAYEDSPGAADDASGVVALMILAEVIAGGKRPPGGIEIAILNGEDHYSTAGELDYLSRFGEKLHEIRLLVNLDDVAYRKGGTRYSFYECPEDLRRTVREVFAGRSGYSEGPPWYQGDHMVFSQQGVPAVAFASDRMEEFMGEFAHTPLDTPELVDCGKLVDLAMGLAEFVRKFEE